MQHLTNKMITTLKALSCLGVATAITKMKTQKSHAKDTEFKPSWDRNLDKNCNASADYKNFNYSKKLTLICMPEYEYAWDWETNTNEV